jgi:hypothetical protein
MAEVKNCTLIARSGDRTARTGQLGQGSQNKTAKIGQLRQISQDSTKRAR